jgi:hypothetical protein
VVLNTITLTPFGTKKQCPYKTGDLLKEIKFIWSFLWQDKKNVTLLYRWLLNNRGASMGRFACIIKLAFISIIKFKFLTWKTVIYNIQKFCRFRYYFPKIFLTHHFWSKEETREVYLDRHAKRLKHFPSVVDQMEIHSHDIQHTELKRKMFKLLQKVSN